MHCIGLSCSAVVLVLFKLATEIRSVRVDLERASIDDVDPSNVPRSWKGGKGLLSQGSGRADKKKSGSDDATNPTSSNKKQKGNQQHSGSDDATNPKSSNKKQHGKQQHSDSDDATIRDSDNHQQIGPGNKINPNDGALPGTKINPDDGVTTGELKALPGNQISPNDGLKWHNGLRCLHGFDPVSWDPTLEEHALKWAKKMEVSPIGLGSKDGAHSDFTLRQNTHGYKNIDENVASGATSGGNLVSFESTIASWYGEIVSTGTDNGVCKDVYGPGPIGGGKARLVGHYCQTIWKETKKIGCAQAKVGSAYYCWYAEGKTNPPKWEENTGPPIKDGKSKCANVPFTNSRPIGWD